MQLEAVMHAPYAVRSGTLETEQNTAFITAAVSLITSAINGPDAAADDFPGPPPDAPTLCKFPRRLIGTFFGRPAGHN